MGTLKAMLSVHSERRPFAAFGCAPMWFVVLVISFGVVSSAHAGSGTSAVAAAMGTPVLAVIDIRPGLCPNHIRVESLLTVPLAVLGTEDLDVANIDPGSVSLSREGFSGQCLPETWAYADVGFPVIGSSPDCNSPAGDGYDDLYLCFSIPYVVKTLGLRGDVGTSVPLVLTGKLVTGQDLEGTDYAAVIGGPWAVAGPGDEIGLLGCRYDSSGTGAFKFSYYTNTSDRVTLAIHDVRGRLVATLVDMDVAPGIYRAAWDGKRDASQPLHAGTYFARVTNSRLGETRKIVLPE